MWLATKHGFYSIIQKEQGVYYVRARVRQDLENLLEASGLTSEVLAWPTADYRYRIIIGSEELLRVVVALTATLDYSNFKGCVAQQPDQRDKLGAYHEIWATMSGFQCEEAVT
ncbi:MAG: hypothetical protein P8R37_12230 [Opitutae bacterium]|nr:hypothetical protein [Opitutae bacterium]